MQPDSLLWSTERADFVERVAKLAGGTTYRTPGAGRGTDLKALPDEHAIAAALAYARQGPNDIGPDVAYCWCWHRTHIGNGRHAFWRWRWCATTCGRSGRTCWRRPKRHGIR